METKNYIKSSSSIQPTSLSADLVHKVQKAGIAIAAHSFQQGGSWLRLEESYKSANKFEIGKGGYSFPSS